jgi:hypothetical protein
MNASEMFEKLGYERNVRNKRIIYYLETKGAFYYKEITFDLLQKEIVIDGNFIRAEIENDLLRAIYKQAEELGWLYEKTCENLSEYNLCDRFECSNCGIVLEEYQEIKVDEDDDTGDECTYEYTPKYCPNCGRKIVD